MARAPLHTLITIEDDELDDKNNCAENEEAELERKVEYPEPPPEKPGKFRYPLWVIFSYVGCGNCIFFCCLSLLAFEEIWRAMGYFPPFTYLCAATKTPMLCCCSPCIICGMRHKFRKKRKIKGNCILDFLFSMLCCCCVFSQLITEARAVILDKKAGKSVPQMPKKNK